MSPACSNKPRLSATWAASASPRFCRAPSSLGERSVTLGESGRQIPDALSQLLSGRYTVYLVRKKHKDKFGELTPGFCWYILKKGPNNIIKHFEKRHMFGVMYETCSSCIVSNPKQSSWTNTCSSCWLILIPCSGRFCGPEVLITSVCVMELSSWVIWAKTVSWLDRM